MASTVRKDCIVDKKSLSQNQMDYEFCAKLMLLLMCCNEVWLIINLIISGDPDGPEFILLFVKDKIRCKRHRRVTSQTYQIFPLINRRQRSLWFYLANWTLLSTKFLQKTSLDACIPNNLSSYWICKKKQTKLMFRCSRPWYIYLLFQGFTCIIPD